MRYRICASGPVAWKVQGKMWGLFWSDCGRWVGQEVWEPWTFATEGDAESAIRNWIADDQQFRAANRSIHQRRREVAPREYP